jgi:hypothetical protein
MAEETVSQAQIKQMIRDAATARGIDPALALRIAEKESNFKPDAIPPLWKSGPQKGQPMSSAYGVFQVTDKTWKQYGGDPAKRKDLNENVRVGINVIAGNKQKFLKDFKREPRPEELYTMHIFGASGGPKLLKSDPSTPLADLFSKTVLRSNPSFGKMNVGEFIASMQKKMGPVGAPFSKPRAFKEQKSGTVPVPAAPRDVMKPQPAPVVPITETTDRIPPVREQRPMLAGEGVEEPQAMLSKDVLEKMGPNYQAALAAMALADTREDDEDDEDSLASQYREQQAAKQSDDIFEMPQRFAGLELGYQSPFFEEQQQPLMMAKGGFVDPLGVPDSGSVTADTRKALTTGQGLNAAEMMRMLRGVGREGVSNLESLARGSVSAVPGVVGDIESLFRDDKNRRFATTKEVERQYLPKRLTAPTKESEGFVEAGTFIDPTIALKAAKPVAKGAVAAGKALAPTAAEMLGKLGPQPMYIVKPTGGTSYPAGMGSKLDDYLLRLHTGVTQYGGEGLKGKDARKLSEFIDTKGRDFFTKRYASPSDQIRDALFEGRISLTGGDLELFPKELLHQAREGFPKSMDELEKTYDKATGMRGTLVLNPRGTENEADTANRLINAVNTEKAKLAKEGASPEEINLKIDDLMRNELGTIHGDSDAARELRKFLKAEKIPPEKASSVMYAAMKGEPIYDLETAYPQMEFMQPNTVIPALASVVDDLDRMSFPEALIRGLQKTDIFRNEEAAIAREADGKKVPATLFERGIEPMASLGDFSLVQVKSPFAVRLEGAAMKHSIGSYATNMDYGIGGKDAFLNGFTKVYSIRDANNRPAVSMDANTSYRTPIIGQIRSVFNSAPTAQEKQAVFNAFDTLFADTPRSELVEALPTNIYVKTREGKILPFEDKVAIDWWQEYTNYLKRNENAR